MHQIKVFVISLANNEDRRKAVEKQFSENDIEFSFYDAVLGKDIPDCFEKKINDSKTVFRRGYPLGIGERGCFYSHYQLWKKCIEIEQPIIVLEDDVIIEDNFKNFAFNNNFLNYEYLKLEKRAKSFISQKDYYLPKHNRSGAVGYFLSPLGARKLVESLVEIYMPSDHYIGAIWLHDLYPACLKDPIIKHNYNLGTNVQSERKSLDKKKEYSLLSRVIRKIIRFKENLQFMTISLIKYLFGKQ